MSGSAHLRERRDVKDVGVRLSASVGPRIRAAETKIALGYTISIHKMHVSSELLFYILQPRISAHIRHGHAAHGRRTGRIGDCSRFGPFARRWSTAANTSPRPRRFLRRRIRRAGCRAGSPRSSKGGGSARRPARCCTGDGRGHRRPGSHRSH